MKKLIYIKSFTAKQELVAEPVPGRVFAADVINGSLSIELGEVTMMLEEGLTENGNFSCEAIVVTKDNYKSLKLNKSDKKLAEELFNQEKVAKAVSKAEQEFEKRLDEAFESFGELAGNDPFLLLSLAKIASHINKTFDEKYGEDNPAVDLQGLMRTSPHGKGFNGGNAAKYIRRYMTDGFSKSNNPEDLLKCAHYLLLELDRREHNI